MSLRISNVMVGVTDMERSVAFYRDQLGLSLNMQFPGFAFFAAGGTTLCLSEAHAKVSAHLVGATEIVFAVDGVNAEYQRLQEQGIEFTHEPRQVTENEHSANFCDPDGHRLSIFGAP